MKKILTGSLLSLFVIGGACAATPWWLQPTVCRVNPTNCYTGMGAGFDTEMWDGVANCRGMKWICPDATIAIDSDPVLMGKNEISANTGINSDFDTSILYNDCFGARKTTANGSQASVGGSYVNVWCNGVLSSPDETLATGEITFGAQPTCTELAADGWVAVLNSKCYGKFYDPGQYYIECAGANLTPNRIIVLNGADAAIGTGSGNYNYPTDTSAAKTLFDKMQSNSATQKAKYFN